MARDIVAEVCHHVRTAYLEPARADAIASALLTRRSTYLGMGGEQLAERLTQDLRELSGDLHFKVAATPLEDSAAAAEDRYKQFLPGPDKNFGLEKAEVLDNNIGLLVVNAMAPIESGCETVHAAMVFVRNVSALVLDLRANRGGSPETVVFIASYLLGRDSVELSGVTWRHTGTRDVFHTRPETARFLFETSVPVVVLVGRGTASAAEQLAYDLQCYGRARIIGEPTAGAAHRVVQFPVGATFTLTVPAGQVTNPISGADWEGRGVIPDVAIPAESALAAACDDLISRA